MHTIPSSSRSHLRIFAPTHFRVRTNRCVDGRFVKRRSSKRAARSHPAQSNPSQSGRKEGNMAPIKVGDKIPDGTLSYFTTEGIQTISIHTAGAGKKIIIFAVPGAFTTTCSLKHVPGFLDNGAALKAKGVSAIYCVSVNDPFVMKQWADTYPTNTDIILFLADGSATFTKALGLELDLTDKGLGIRSTRYALLVDDLTVKVANIEAGGAFEVSSAEDMLKALE